LTKGKSGRHEWLIEFKRLPSELSHFCDLLDYHLKRLNSDYEAKRYHDLVLDKPKIVVVPLGSFYNWMKKNNKLGAQHKVPRLFNTRKYIEELKCLIAEKGAQAT